MTSNERIILKCLWDAKGKAHICFISRTTGLNSDYARLLARSLERAGYLKFADANVCYLLTRGRNRFEDSNPIIETAEPDAIVNPEIIVETVEEITDSDEKSEDENKQDEDLDQVLTELDQFVKEEAVPESSAEPELAEEEGSEAGDEKLVEEIQNKILEEEARVEELVSDQGQIIEEAKENIEKEDLAEAPVSRLIQNIGISLKKAASWINQARRKTENKLS